MKLYRVIAWLLCTTIFIYYIEYITDEYLQRFAIANIDTTKYDSLPSFGLCSTDLNDESLMMNPIMVSVVQFSDIAIEKPGHHSLRKLYSFS